MLGNKDENRLCGWFFEQFEQFIGGRAVHFLRLPDDHDLIAVSVGFETKFMEDFPTLFLIDHALLCLNPQGFMPVIQIEIMVRKDDLAPGFKEGVTGIACIRFDDREDEMQVRVLQFFKLQTSGAHAATIFFRPMGTIEILCVG